MFHDVSKKAKLLSDNITKMKYKNLFRTNITGNR